MMPGKKHYWQSLVLSSLQYHDNYDFCYDQGPISTLNVPLLGSVANRKNHKQTATGLPSSWAILSQERNAGRQGGWGTAAIGGGASGLLSGIPAHPHTSVPPPADKNFISLSCTLFLRKCGK